MPPDDTAASLDEIARLVALLCRRLGPEDESLQDFVVQLSDLGFPPARIAELSGTSANYASVALARARKKAPPKTSAGRTQKRSS